MVAYGSEADRTPGTDAVVSRTPSDSHVRLATALRDAADHDPVPYPAPAGEPDRLDTLGDYDLDAGDLPIHLDGLATAVTDSLDARAGFVGVVDDATERFVAADGLDVSSVPREESVCSYGLLRDDPLVVPDPDGDVRVPDDPLGAAFDVEFYAGVPLRTDDDHCLGMVCALDDEPRVFSETDEQALSWFADEVVGHIETRGVE